MIKVRSFLKLILSYAACCIMFCTHDSAAMRAGIPTYNSDDATVRKITAYVREYINPNMHHIASRAQLSVEQQGHLYSWIEGKRFTDISGQKAYAKRRETFDSGSVDDYGKRDNLVSAWCKKYGDVAWPTETIKRGGLRLQAQFHAHHIVPLEFGGLNRWWNIIPLPSKVHRAVHTEIDGRFTGGGVVSITIASLASIFRSELVE